MAPHSPQSQPCAALAGGLPSLCLRMAFCLPGQLWLSSSSSILTPQWGCF